MAGLRYSGDWVLDALMTGRSHYELGPGIFLTRPRGNGKKDGRVHKTPRNYQVIAGMVIVLSVFGVGAWYLYGTVSPSNHTSIPYHLHVQLRIYDARADQNITVPAGIGTAAGSWVHHTLDSFGISGTAGSLQRSTTFSLTVFANDYTLTLSPNSGAVLPGGSTMTSVTVDGGLQEIVNLACPNIPSGVSCSFLPASGAPTFTSSLNIGTISTLAPGSYTITVRGTSQTTSLVRQATYTLMVPGVMVNPANINSVVTQFTVKVSVSGFTPFNGFDVRLLYHHQSAGGPLDATILTSVCPQNGISPGPPCVFPAGAQISTSVFRIDAPTAGEIRVVQSSTLAADAPGQGDLFTITFSVVGQGTSLLNITLEDFFLGIDTVPHVTRDGCYLPGDVSQDGVVNVSDLARVGASFLKSTGQPGFDAGADLNKDGTVNVLDLVVVGANFLKSC